MTENWVLHYRQLQNQGIRFSFAGIPQKELLLFTLKRKLYAVLPGQGYTEEGAPIAPTPTEESWRVEYRNLQKAGQKFQCNGFNDDGSWTDGVWDFGLAQRHYRIAPNGFNDADIPSMGTQLEQAKAELTRQQAMTRVAIGHLKAVLGTTCQTPQDAAAMDWLTSLGKEGT